MEENILKTMEIKKLIKNVSIPLMISMFVQAIYNVVDSIFVSGISQESLLAISYSYPVQILMMSIAVGTSIGVNALLSKTLGQKNNEKAKKIVENATIIAFAFSAIFMIVSIFGMDTIVKLYHTSSLVEKEIHIYLCICMFFSFGLFYTTICERFLQANGFSKICMMTQMFGAISNVVLDPIFIYYFQLDVAGAAIATVLGQWISMLSAFYFYQKKCPFKVTIALSIDINIMKDIFKLSLPQIIMQMCGSCFMMFMNIVLQSYGEYVVSTFSVYYKLWILLFMPVSGFSQGLLSIVGFNFGAHRYDRIKEALKYTLIGSIIIMLTGTVIFITFHTQILSFYHADHNMMKIGDAIFSILPITYIVSAITITLGFYCSALHQSQVNMIATLLRQVIIPIPLIFIFQNMISYHHIWFLLYIGEIVATIYTICQTKKYNKLLMN